MDRNRKKLTNFSVWEEQFLRKPKDVTIVGAGICGLFSALFIKKRFPKINIIVLEKEAFGNVASTKNAGFACFGSAGELLDDVKELGWNKSADLLTMRLKGLDLLRKYVPNSKMDYSACGGWEIFDINEKKRFSKTADQLEGLNLKLQHILPKPYTVIKKPKCLLAHKEAVFQEAEGSLNPFLLMQFLKKECAKKDIQILTSCTVENARKNNAGYLVNTGLGALQTEKLVLTTNLNKMENLLPKIITKPARAQVIMSQPLDIKIPKGVFHAKKGYCYFRFVNKQLLLGGMRHLFLSQEETENRTTEAKLIASLQQYGEQLIGKPIKVAHAWAGTMSVGANRFPHIGYDENLIYGLKMGGMGVAIGAFVGKKISEYV